MLNILLVIVVLVSVLLAAATGRMEALTQGVLTDARKAVELALGLVGAMAFFLGLMRVAQDGGLTRQLARAVGPLLHRLFPGVPADHPAMSAMILNISSNMLGLANAATPFGIKAIEELDTLNSRKGTATNAMVLFLAINTAGLAVLPTGVIALRASLGSEDAAGIFLTTWVASGSATLIGITAALLLGRLPRYRATEPPPLDEVPASDLGTDTNEGESGLRRPRFARWIVAAFWIAFLALAVRHLWGTPRDLVGAAVRDVASYWILPALVGGLVLYGWSRGVRVYDSLVEGAKEGFQVALRIIPYLVAILVAVGMLRSAGGIDFIVATISPATDLIRLPAEALPMALLRPLSGSGAYGVMAEIMTRHGADSFVGYLVSTFQGSTETTFYVLAVYYGAIGVKRTRHTLPVCLMADVAGILAAVMIVNLLYG
jgi:spore maturation protein SpmA